MTEKEKFKIRYQYQKDANCIKNNKFFFDSINIKNEDIIYKYLNDVLEKESKNKNLIIEDKNLKELE